MLPILIPVQGIPSLKRINKITLEFEAMQVEELTIPATSWALARSVGS
jgi:hypothetical protein